MCCTYMQHIHRVLPQVSSWANSDYIHCSRNQDTAKIYNPDTNNNTVLKLLLCAYKYCFHILIIYEIRQCRSSYLKKNVNIMERIMRRRSEAGNYKILKNWGRAWRETCS